MAYICQGQTTPRQHAQPDLVERDRVADAFGHGQAFERIGNIKGNDQTVIGHGILAFWIGN